MTQSPAPPHLGDAKQGQKEGSKGDPKREEFPVSLQDLEVVRQAGDDGLHASHLHRARRGEKQVGGTARPPGSALLSSRLRTWNYVGEAEEKSPVSLWTAGLRLLSHTLA